MNYLKKTAEELDEKVYSLNYIYAVRWLASQLIAIKKIKEMF
jgi:hypothetical protein